MIPDRMTANHYEKPDLNIVEFTLEDILTQSSTVTTTTAPTTTLPATTSGGVELVTGQHEIYVDVSDFFK